MIRPMAKLFIAGHSDSDGRYLPPGTLPWPDRTLAWLADTTSTPWELGGVRFAPMGDSAVEYLMSKVEAAAPEIVILPLTAYVCTIGTVAESVRVRFGPRMQRLFLASESKFQARTRQGRTRRFGNHAARRVARRLLGTRTMATVAQTTAIYEQVLHQLAQVESLQVVVVADARFSSETQEREPLLHQRIDQMYAAILPVAIQHRFVVADLEVALRRAPDRRVFYQDDGVHTTAAFHDVYFGVVQAALRDVLPAVPA